MNIFFTGIDLDGSYESLLFIALILIVGVIFAKFSEFAKLPHITGYIFGGIIIGMVIKEQFEEGTHILEHSENTLTILSSTALGFIAFMIGTELWLPRIKKSGKDIVIITLTQAFFTAVVTMLGIWVFSMELWMALIIGAIASVTAPGPLIVVSKKFKSKGPLTDTVFPIVGLDDAVGIILFGISVSIAVTLRAGTDLNLSLIFTDPHGPIMEILKSIGVGIAVGLPLGLFVNHSSWWRDEKQELFLALSITVVLAATALSHIWHLSPVLTTMVIGSTFTNMIDKETYQFEERVLENFSPPINILFFTIAGVELGRLMNIELIKKVWPLVIIYVVTRTVGKYFGTRLGAKLAGSKPVIKKNLGKLLLPQGGVEIGLAVSIAFMPAFLEADSSGFTGNHVKIVILFGVVIFEVIGPLLVTKTLSDAGEINTKYMVDVKAGDASYEEAGPDSSSINTRTIKIEAKNKKKAKKLKAKEVRKVKANK